MKCYGPLKVIVIYKLRSYGAPMKVIGNADKQERTAGWTAEPRVHTFRFDDGNRLCFGSDGSEVCQRLRLGLQPFRSGTSSLLTRKFRNQSKRFSIRVAAALFRIGSDALRLAETSLH